MSSRALLTLFALLALVALSQAANVPVAAPELVRAEEVETESESDPSPEPSPEEESDSDEVCVDAAYLASYPTHQLVHARHIRAVALCPAASTLPCGTPDHLVRLDGKNISYRQLCATRKCESRRIDVNSVLSHVWNEEAHGDVSLTMYDARHPELVQRALHRLIAARRAIAARFA